MSSLRFLLNSTISHTHVPSFVGSVRLFSQNKVNTSALCTVLPPPIVSLLSSVKDVTISRFNGLVFLLIDSGKLWIYTTKTDPACR